MLKRYRVRKVLCLLLMISVLASFIVVSSPASAAGSITNLSVSDTANAADWSIQSNLQAGDTQYGDRTFTFTTVPSSVAGADWIRTANDSKAYTADPMVTFTVAQDADVYVAHNDNITTKPVWLSGWTDTGSNLVNNESTPVTFSLYKKTFTAGSVVSLGNNRSTSYGMYTVAVKPVAASTSLITNLTVNDTANAADWSIQKNLQSGNTEYGDRTFTFSSVPSLVAGSDWIRTANDSKSYTGTTLVTFTVTADADVYVAHMDNIATKPSWLNGWTDTGSNLTNDESTPKTFSLYKKTFAANSVVSLGDNGDISWGMYTIIVKASQGSSTPTPTPTTTPTPTATPTATPTPPSTTYNVKNYGAKGDGSTDDTTAINNAISAANAAGGGTVSFPSGNYSAKSIHLKSNVYLYLDSGSAIIARTGQDAPESNPYDSYQDFGHSHFHNALIWGENLNNIKITGKGTIDGNGNLTSSDSPGNGTGDKAISLKLCTNVEIGGDDMNNRLTMKLFGHFAILATGCDYVNIHDIFVPYADSNQRDFLDIMQCNDVTVTNIESTFTKDDVIKLGSDYSLGYKRPMNNVTVKNIKANTNCNVCMIGSETVAPISNVSFTDITVLGAGKAGLGITVNDGSVVDGVTLTNCTMTGTTTPFWIKINNRGRAPSPSIGRIKNVTITNVTATNCEGVNGEYTATIAGYKNGSTVVDVENVTLNNVKITAKGGHSTSDASITPPELSGSQYNARDMGTRPAYGWYMRYVTGIKFTNGCSVGFDSTDGRYAVVVDDGNGVEFDGFTMQKGSSPRVQIKNGCMNFYMHSCPNLSDVGPVDISGTQTY